MKRIILLFLPVLILISCRTKDPERGIQDLIKTVNLTSGEKSVFQISDLFYSPDYNLNFRPNSNIEIAYNPGDMELTLTPGENYSGFTTVEFSMNKESFQIPVRVKKIQKVTFSYKPQSDFESLTVFGEFNDWNRTTHPFTDENNDSVYDVTLALEPGTYQYKFFIDGKEITDLSNPDSVSNGMGSFNNLVTVEPLFKNENFIHVKNYEKNGSGYRYLFIYEPGEQTSKISSGDVTALVDNKLVRDIKVKDNEITVNVAGYLLNAENDLRVAVTHDGQVTNLHHTVLFEGVPAGNNSEFTWYDGIIYSLMIDRFSDGDKSINDPVKNDSVSSKANYNGGDLAGIIKKIEEGYFDSLDINVLWISPVYDNPEKAYKEYPEPHRWFTGYHGYWPVSATNVEENFGTINQLQDLVSIAHNHGIKVLLDFVSNHVHEEHPFYKKHPEWFGNFLLPDGSPNIRLWDAQRLTTWFEPYMPSFDYMNSDTAVTVMTDNAYWWLKQTGADGFRHDAVKHVPYKFWRELTRKLKEKMGVPQNKHIYQIGETFGSYELTSSYVNNGQLSSQFNFNLYNVAQAAFINPDFNFADLDADMKKTFHYYGPIHFMGNIMDSHDKNRYMAFADGDLRLEQWSAIEEGWNNPPKVDKPSSYKKAELYLAYMHTIPGLPVIYYGSEFGMTGASDPDNRRMMRFGNQLNKYEKQMLAVSEDIVKMRNEHPALRYGDYYTVKADDNVYAYVRSDFNERLLVILNKDESKLEVDLMLPVEVYAASKLVDVNNGDEYNLNDGNVVIPVNAIGWRVLKIK